MIFYPSVIETTGRSSKAYDLPTKLLQDRIVYLSGKIDDQSVDSIIMQLLWLNADNPNEDINLYICSPGGSVYHGMAIKNIMDTLSCKVNTVGMGMCASMGAYLLASGTGKRKSMKDNRIMIHSVSSAQQGTFHDLKVDFRESEYIQNKVIDHMVRFTKGKTTLQDMKDKCERDYYMSPEEAQRMGLIDEIIQKQRLTRYIQGTEGCLF